MRKYINIINEIYSKDNNYLLKYMRAGDKFDPYTQWYLLAEWLFNNYLDEVNESLLEWLEGAEEVESQEELEEMDAEFFYQLPKHIQKEGEEYITSWLQNHAPDEVPTNVAMNLSNNKLLHRQTWLIHFSDNAREIANNGFKYGVDQMDKLALTTWQSDNDKKYGGYNFAFEADSKYARQSITTYGDPTYGRHAVMFQNSGVKAYHYGDEEDQIMFWGKDVNPRNIVLLYNDGGDWGVVPAKHNLRDGREYVFKGTFDQVVAWVKKNFNQYRKILTGF